MDTYKKELLKRFKHYHKKLVLLKPTIKILEITESYSSKTNKSEVFNPPLFQIHVFHDFICDNRLVPKRFENIEVINITKSSTLPKQFNPETELPLWEVESQSNYEMFVDTNFNLIRNKLNSPSMQRDEMLDALTGDFKKHIQYYEKLKRRFGN